MQKPQFLPLVLAFLARNGILVGKIKSLRVKSGLRILIGGLSYSSFVLFLCVGAKGLGWQALTTS